APAIHATSNCSRSNSMSDGSNGSETQPALSSIMEAFLALSWFVMANLHHAEVHTEHVGVADGNCNRVGVRRCLCQPRGQHEDHLIIAGGADARGRIRVIAWAALLSEGVLALAVGHERGQHIAAGVQQLHGDAGEALAAAISNGAADRCLENEDI